MNLSEQMILTDKMVADYHDNVKFRDYVDKYCISNYVPIMVALKHSIVFEYWKSIQRGECNEE